jgi:DNA-binding NarL/FixJ family response regulator
MESISRGLRNPDIARSLKVSEKTIKNHVNKIFTKLGARSRVEAVLIWQDRP